MEHLFEFCRSYLDISYIFAISVGTRNPLSAYREEEVVRRLTIRIVYKIPERDNTVGNISSLFRYFSYESICTRLPYIDDTCWNAYHILLGSVSVFSIEHDVSIGSQYKDYNITIGCMRIADSEEVYLLAFCIFIKRLPNLLVSIIDNDAFRDFLHKKEPAKKDKLSWGSRF